MSKQAKRNTLSLALGAAVVGTMGLAGAANATEADEDLFAMEELSSGFLIAGAHEEGGCGEDKDKEGGEDEDEGEGSCGEGKCGSKAT